MARTQSESAAAVPAGGLVGDCRSIQMQHRDDERAFRFDAAGCRATMAERAAGDQRSYKLISFVSILLIDAASVEARNE